MEEGGGGAMFPQGEPNPFGGVTGRGDLNMLAEQGVAIGSVTFEPGARSNWHIHPVGQVLVITSGVGRTQEWGKPVQEVRPGDVVICPVGVKHWHGAAPNSSMSHISICEEKEPGKVVEWMEKVTDEQYNGK